MTRLIALVCFVAIAAAQQHITFPAPQGRLVNADIYGEGDRAVVLAHGGMFKKEGWDKQARVLAAAGFRAMAIDFGESHPEIDVLAAVRYLRKNGARTVSIVGASMGGEAAADASIESQPGEIDRLVLLAGWTNGPAEQMKGRKLFIVAKDDANSDGPRLPKIRANYERTPGPKKLIILPGTAHAQFLFATDQGDRLMREILNFLSQP